MNMSQQIPTVFLAPQMPEAIWAKYFKGQKMFGISEPNFLGRSNGIRVSLTSVHCGDSGAPKRGGPPTQLPALPH